MISLERVSKRFGDVVAVSDVSFEIGPGITALLGPNGSGKTTLLRLICGLTTPSNGVVNVLGRRTRSDVSVFRHMGLAPESEALFRDLTALEFVALGAGLHGLSEPESAAARSLEAVELDPSDRRRLETYSKGMRQRAKLAHAMVHDPEILLLDEPLNGLDPRQRSHAIEVFRRLGDEGRCIVVSSHVLADVERIGSRVLVLAEGRLLAEGDFHAIRELLDDRPHRLLVRTSDARELGAGLLESGSASGVSISDGRTVVVDASDIGSFRRSVARVARNRGVRLEEITPLDDDLESVFRYLVTRRAPARR